MKRMIFIILIASGIVGLFYIGTEEGQSLTYNHVEKIDKTTDNKILPETILRRFWEITDLHLDASSVLLIDAETGHVIYEKNSDMSLPTASMSKMMTELLVLEAIETDKLAWNKEVTISDYAYDISNHPGYASVHLAKENTYTVKELFDAMAIHSANGATIALAEAVSGSEELFVQQMNNKAQEIGLQATEFVNSTGLDNNHLGDYFSVGGVEDTNTMSAHDLATLAKYIINHYPTLLDITSEPQYVGNNKQYVNTNWMLSGEVAFDGVDGLKTGYTDLAGYGFTGTVKQGNIRLISVVMGTDSEWERFRETKQLYEKAFEQINKWSDSA